MRGARRHALVGFEFSLGKAWFSGAATQRQLSPLKLKKPVTQITSWIERLLRAHSSARLKPEEG